MPRHETRDELPDESAAPERQRIAKLMARVGLCSRREAEAWILDGRVSVNGEVLTSPAFDVRSSDAILVDGAPLPQAEKTRLFLFHKPRGLVTSDHDPEGRATVADYLREHWPDGPRVVTVGRLDINTEGLLLLTNDGGLARLLELPKTGWVRRYRVRAKGETDQSVLDTLADGLTIEGVDYAGIEAKLDRQQGANVWLTMGLREGKNREVKRVLESLGLEVNRLIRLSFGPFQLGDVPEGAVEEIRTRVLRDQLGPALAAEAGVAFEDAPPPERQPARPVREGRRKASSHDDRPDTGRSAPRGGDRPLRRGGDRPPPRDRDAPQPIRERPTAGTRKHVTTLRSEEAEMARKGPRRRIVRSDVKDRRDRTVTVERIVDARPLTPTRTRSGTRPERGDAPRGAKPGRHASPSAMAKRARVARSSGGVEADARGDRREDAAAPRRRPEQRAGAGGMEGRANRTRPARTPGERAGPRKTHADRESENRQQSRERHHDGRPSRDGQGRRFAETMPTRREDGTRGRSEARERASHDGVRTSERPVRGDKPGFRDAQAKRFGDERPMKDARGSRDGTGRPPRAGGKPPARSSGGGGPARGKPRRPGGDGRGKPRPRS